MKDIDEAIKSCDEVVTANKRSIDYHKIQGDTEWIDENEEDCIECAEANRQLAKWLRELKKYRSIFEKVGKILADNGYTIDDLDTVNREVNADEDSD